jgi:hypothetical protein
MGVEASKVHHEISIIIDRAEYKVPAETMTGAQLRQVPMPPIGPEFDLYEVVPGPGEDVLLGDNQVIRLKNGMHFITAPRVITPGR